jgi:hypothetical protein
MATLQIKGEHGYEYRGYNAGCIVSKQGLMELVARVISEDFEEKEWSVYDAALLEKLAGMIRAGQGKKG